MITAAVRGFIAASRDQNMIIHSVNHRFPYTPCKGGRYHVAHLEGLSFFIQWLTRSSSESKILKKLCRNISIYENKTNLSRPSISGNAQKVYKPNKSNILFCIYIYIFFCCRLFTIHKIIKTQKPPPHSQIFFHCQWFFCGKHNGTILLLLYPRMNFDFGAVSAWVIDL